MEALTFVCNLEIGKKKKPNQNQTFKNGEDLPYFPQICPVSYQNYLFSFYKVVDLKRHLGITLCLPCSHQLLSSALKRKKL